MNSTIYKTDLISLELGTGETGICGLVLKQIFIFWFLVETICTNYEMFAWKTGFCEVLHIVFVSFLSC